MGKDYLGEFEELVMLIIAMMKDEAYGLAICDEIRNETGRKATIGAVHATVARLEKKGFVDHKTYGRTHVYFPLIKKKDYTKFSSTSFCFQKIIPS